MVPLIALSRDVHTGFVQKMRQCLMAKGGAL